MNEFLKELQELCRKHDALIVNGFDNDYFTIYIRDNSINISCIDKDSATDQFNNELIK